MLTALVLTALTILIDILIAMRPYSWSPIMLAALDIIKLFLSFSFALALIWAREWYLRKREIKQKQETLWEILTHDLNDIRATDESLMEARRSYKRDEISPRIFLTNLLPVEYAQRLAELDHQNADVYGAYEIEAEGSQLRWESLGKLREQFFKEHDNDARGRLAQAIEKEFALARKAMIALLEAELAVLKTIQEARDKDELPITQFETIVENLKNEE